MAKKGMFPPSLTKVTLFSKCMALFLLILFPFAGFYIGMNYQRVQDSKAQQISSQQPTPTAIPTAIPKGQALNLTLADSGKTFYVSVGTGILVSLSSEGTTWQVRSSDSSILKSFQMGIAQRVGDPLVYRFTALKKGTAQIIGEGTASCKKNTPCAQYLLRYNVEIVVQ